MAFATNNDLIKYVPDIFDHGVDDWTDELAMAETDVADMVKVKYWNNHYDPQNFDKANLTESQWTKSTVYRALSTYILPKLATFRVDDVFMEQINFYKNRFGEEFDLQFAIGIDYDIDEDGTVDAGEQNEYRQDRLYR